MWLVGSKPVADVYLGRHVCWAHVGDQLLSAPSEPGVLPLQWLQQVLSAEPKARVKVWLGCWWARAVKLPNGLDTKSGDELKAWLAASPIADASIWDGVVKGIDDLVVAADGVKAVVYPCAIGAQLKDALGSRLQTIAPWWAGAVNHYCAEGVDAVAVFEPDGATFLIEIDGELVLLDGLCGNVEADTSLRSASWERILMSGLIADAVETSIIELAPEASAENMTEKGAVQRPFVSWVSLR